MHQTQGPLLLGDISEYGYSVISSSIAWAVVEGVIVEGDSAEESCTEDVCIEDTCTEWAFAEGCLTGAASNSALDALMNFSLERKGESSWRSSPRTRFTLLSLTLLEWPKNDCFSSGALMAAGGICCRWRL